MPLFCGASSTAKVLERDEFCVELPMILNVRGKEFQVLPSTVKTYGPNRTLLEKYALGSDRSGHKPARVFVEANPDRFPFILDWYMYREVDVPLDVVRPFLRDAAYFKLPSPIIVNGTRWPLPSDDEVEECLTHRSAGGLCDDIRSSIARDWPNFEPYVVSVLAKVERQVAERAVHARSVKTDVDSVEAPFTVWLPLSTPTHHGSKQQKWKDECNVCNRERMNVLMSAIQDHGYTCVEDPVRLRPDGTWKPLGLIVGLGGRVGEKVPPKDALCGSSTSASSGYASSVGTPYTSEGSSRCSSRGAPRLHR